MVDNFWWRWRRLSYPTPPHLQRDFFTVARIYNNIIFCKAERNSDNLHAWFEFSKSWWRFYSSYSLALVGQWRDWERCIASCSQSLVVHDSPFVPVVSGFCSLSAAHHSIQQNPWKSLSACSCHALDIHSPSRKTPVRMLMDLDLLAR